MRSASPVSVVLACLLFLAGGFIGESVLRNAPDVPHVAQAATLASSSSVSSSSSVFSGPYPSGSTADLSIEGAGPQRVDRGTAFGNTFIVRDLGPAIAHDVRVTEPIPGGYLFDAAGSTPGCAQSASSVVCVLGTIGDAEPRLVTVSFRTALQDACTERTFQTNADVDASESDSIARNDTTAVIATTVACPAARGECADGRDNDRDGLIDYPADTGCRSSDDALESRDQSSSVAASDEARRLQRIQARNPAFRSSSSSLAASAGAVTVTGPDASAPDAGAPGTVTVTSPEDNNVSAALPTLSLRADRTEVQPGDTVVLFIDAANDTDGESSADAVLAFASDQLSVLQADGAMLGTDSARWSLDLAPHEHRTVRLTARVGAVLPGATITASAHAAGSVTGPDSVAVLTVMTRLPATGAGDHTGPLEDTSRFLTPLGRGAGAPATVLLAIAAMGVALAGHAGRRLF
jgi:hypothetical protein